MIRSDTVPRVNIKISDELKQFFEEKSKESGASQSSLMSFALSEYVEQKKAMSMMKEFTDFIKNNPGVIGLNNNDKKEL